MYTSTFPSVSLPTSSIYTFLLNPPNKQKFNPDSVAFIDAPTGRSITRRQLGDLALTVGWGVQNKLKAKRGDVAMIFSPNSLPWPITLYGLIAAGLRATLANSSYTAPELVHQLKDSGAHYIFVHPLFLPTVVSALEILKIKSEAKKRVIIMGYGDDLNKLKAGGWMVLEDLLHGGKKLEQEERFEEEQLNETVLLCYSSGTTGLSKGVETTHRNVTSVISMVQPIFPVFDPANDAWIGVLPFYHIYGCVKLLFFAFSIGVPVAILPSFTPDSFCQAIERYKLSCGLIVPPILVALSSSPAVDKYDVRSLKGLFSGAAPLGEDLIRRVKKRLASVGSKCEVTQGYGLTETSPTTHLLDMKDSERKAGSCGKLVPNLEACLVDSDGNDVEEGKSGELWVRGPSIMKGYLGNKAATDNAITKDGWFKTGDVALRDSEGFYTVVDRVKELIKYKGFQVPPAELEALLLQHPQVLDAGVIGIYSEEQATELPRAYVVIKDGPQSLGTKEARAKFQKEIQNWVEGHVAKHKYLRGGVSVIDIIPKSAAGKILRRQLRDLAKKELEAEMPRSKL